MLQATGRHIRYRRDLWDSKSGQLVISWSLDVTGELTLN